MGSRWDGRRLSVAIPASLVSDTPHLREKTGKLGSVARACSIFAVSEIILYADDAHRDQEGDFEFCMEILRFIETPQYLRKRIFRLTPNLRFTGILPPLQTPAHEVPRAIQESRVEEVRDGVVIARREGRLLVDVGLEKALECVGDFPVGRRVTVRVTKLAKNPLGEIVDDSKASISQVEKGPVYWGYKVAKADSSLGRFVEKEKFDLAIGTSRYGSPIADLWSRLATSLKSAQRILVAFGSPKMGLRDILKQENITPEDVFDYFVNSVPNQNVSTVRTEEAILISLGIFNLATSIY
jgi:predicted SPOUT superfamily RNA methylase MTH1